MAVIKSTMPVSVEESSTFKPYYINEFKISSPLTTDKSGFAKWGVCEKNRIKYFIKEFLTPVYPDKNSGLSQEIIDIKINECNEWFTSRKIFYENIIKAQTGNIIAPKKFFKDNNHFYIVTELIENKNDDMNFDELCQKADFEQREILIKTLAYAFYRLGENGVVHSDIKPENLLIKKTIDNFYTIKIIDFDSGYMESNPPFGDDVQGNLVYDSPELLLAFNENDGIVLNSKSDIFSLGLIFHQILSGKFPEFSDEYDYINEAVLDDSEIILSDSIDYNYRNVIKKMLEKDVNKRPDMKEIFYEIMSFKRKSIKKDKKEEMHNTELNKLHNSSKEENSYFKNGLTF